MRARREPFAPLFPPPSNERDLLPQFVAINKKQKFKRRGGGGGGGKVSVSGQTQWFETSQNRRCPIVQVICCWKRVVRSISLSDRRSYISPEPAA